MHLNSLQVLYEEQVVEEMTKLLLAYSKLGGIIGYNLRPKYENSLRDILYLHFTQ